MYVFNVVVNAIALMRCAGCGVIMRQGEREVSPRHTDGRPLHIACKAKLDALATTEER